MTQSKDFDCDAKKLSWLLGLDKETLANMANQQSKIIEKLQEATKDISVNEWISVSDDRPEKKQGNKIWATDGIDQFECEFDDGFWCNVFGNEFTHWRQLPKLPAITRGGE